MGYVIHLLTLIGIYLILAQGFNLVFGVAGLFNLAHIAAWAIGAYTTAILATDFSAGTVSCLIASAIVSGLLALPVGVISLKLQQEYFAIGTLAFSSMVSALLINWKSLTGGVLGITGIPRPVLLGWDFSERLDFMCFVYVLLILSNALLYFAFKNSFSRKLRAQSEFEEGALALGLNTQELRTECFLIASICAGISGSLFAYFMQYIDPSSFLLNEMVFVLTIVVLGRPGNFTGCILATFFLLLLPEALRFTGEVQGWLEQLFALKDGESLAVPLLNLIVRFFNWVSSPAVLGPMRQMLYAVILFLVAYANRSRLFPLRRKL